MGLQDRTKRARDLWDDEQISVVEVSVLSLLHRSDLDPNYNKLLFHVNNFVLKSMRKAEGEERS